MAHPAPGLYITGASLIILSIQSYIDIATSPFIVKSRRVPKDSCTLPCLIDEGILFLYLSLKDFGSGGNHYQILCHILRSPIRHAIVHCLPSMILLITHTS